MPVSTTRMKLEIRKKVIIDLNKELNLTLPEDSKHLECFNEIVSDEEELQLIHFFYVMGLSHLTIADEKTVKLCYVRATHDAHQTFRLIG